MRVLIFAVLLAACHKEPVVDHAELDRLRAEQRALAAKVEALQARIDRAPVPSPVAAPVPVPAPPATPRARPLLTNIDTAETGAVVTTHAVAPAPTPDTTPSGALHTEDLHGAAVGGAASPPSSGGLSDTEGAAMLDQLQAQMKQLKTSQAAEQSALDQLEKMR